MGIARYHLKQNRRAIEDYSRAIRFKPDYADAYTGRGWSYQVSGQYDRAIADFNQAIRLAPDDLLAYNNRGVAYEKKGMLEEAIADFQYVLSTPGKANDTDDRDAKKYARNNLRRVRGKLRQRNQMPTAPDMDSPSERVISSNPDTGASQSDPVDRSRIRLAPMRGDEPQQF